MIGMPRLTFKDFTALYEYVKKIALDKSSRQAKISELIIKMNDAGVEADQENAGQWLNPDDVKYIEQPGPRICSMFLPDKDTIEAIEKDDKPGDRPYPLPDFYAKMFECDKNGDVVPRTLTPSERKEFRKKRLADYMTQKCF